MVKRASQGRTIQKDSKEDVRMCPALPVKQYSIKENFFSIVLPGIVPN